MPVSVASRLAVGVSRTPEVSVSKKGTWLPARAPHLPGKVTGKRAHVTLQSLPCNAGSGAVIGMLTGSIRHSKETKRSSPAGGTLVLGKPSESL